MSPRTKPAARSTSAKKWDRRGRDPIPISGRRPIEELLRRRIQPVVLLTTKRAKSGKDDPLLVRCRNAGWKVDVKDKSDLDRASEGLNHQGYVAFIGEFPYLTIDELIARSKASESQILIALDQIQDAGNLGAILRSAECAGAGGAIIPAHRAAGVTPAVMRRSAGAALHLPICRTANLSHALDRLKEAGYRIIGADQEGAISLYDTDVSGQLVIVIGSEGRGLRPGIKRRCDTLVAIPLKGRISSLNASAAAAVILFEITRAKNTRR